MKIEYAMILPTIDDIHAAAELLKGKKLIDKERQRQLSDYLDTVDLSEEIGRAHV